jgi:hypothetical protein
MIEYNAAKRPSGLRACADGLDSNPDKDFAQKCMRYAADRMEELEQQRDRLAEVLQRIRDGYGGQVASPNCCEDCDYLLPIDEALAAVKSQPTKS